jgi:hypothetical protein
LYFKEQSVKHTLSVLILVSAMMPVAAWSFTINVLTSNRSLEVSEQDYGTTSILTSDSGTYSDIYLPVGPEILAEFVTSDIPASGVYSTYEVSAEMFTVFDAPGPYIWGKATAEMGLVFTVDNDVNYAISGSLVTNGPLAGSNLLLARISGAGGDLCTFPTCFSSNGVLQAGEIYSLYAMTSGGDITIINTYSDSTLAFNMTLSEVPIPAAIWLFGSGLIGLVGVARRKK